MQRNLLNRLKHVGLGGRLYACNFDPDILVFNLLVAIFEIFWYSFVLKDERCWNWLKSKHFYNHFGRVLKQNYFKLTTCIEYFFTKSTAIQVGYALILIKSDNFGSFNFSTYVRAINTNFQFAFYVKQIVARNWISCYDFSFVAYLPICNLSKHTRTLILNQLLATYT